MINAERLCGHLDGEFSVFLIGMRVNRLWKLHKWVPVILAMARMIKELRTTPDAGLLSYEMWFGRTTIMVQYWRSAEQLLAYAKNQDAAHYPSWRAFNRAVSNNGDVGIWHETYLIAAGAYEAIYVNMPAFGLGRAGKLLPATGSRATAAGRLKGDAVVKSDD
ncbi:MAG: DUF4188 domain-containing protein [Sulfuriferula sp.]